MCKKYLLFFALFVLSNVTNTLITDNEIANILHLDSSLIHQICKTIEKMKAKHEGAWKSYYSVIPSLIKNNNLSIGCEVGVAFGGHSEAILQNTNISKLFSVDPYLEYGDKTTNPAVGNNDSAEQFIHQLRWDVLYLQVIDRLSIFKERSQFIRDTSVNAAQSFENESLDFVFIDASHTYKAVLDDLKVWHPKIRVGGFICGDDYNFKEVKRAVDQFIKAQNLTLVLNKNKRTWYAQVK